MFIQTQGEQEAKKGPIVICKVKENDNNNNHLRRAYSMHRFKMKPVLAASYLIFLTPVGGRYHHLHFTAQDLMLRSKKQLAQSQENWKRQESGPGVSAPTRCTLITPRWNFELSHFWVNASLLAEIARGSDISDGSRCFLTSGHIHLSGYVVSFPRARKGGLPYSCGNGWAWQCLTLSECSENLCRMNELSLFASKQSPLEA